MVAVVPVLLARSENGLDEILQRARSSAGVSGLGREFITANGERSFWFFTWARWACIPFSLAGRLRLLSLGARVVRGMVRPAGVDAVVLRAEILANAQMITPDTGATAFGLTAAYIFWKWLKTPGWPLALLPGLALGLAVLTKTTWIILFALWPALWLVVAAAPTTPPFGVGLARTMPSTGGNVSPSSLTLLNLGYGFEDSFVPLGEFTFISESLGGPQQEKRFFRRRQPLRRYAGCGSLPVPVPSKLPARHRCAKARF